MPKSDSKIRLAYLLVILLLAIRGVSCLPTAPTGSKTSNNVRSTVSGPSTPLPQASAAGEVEGEDCKVGGGGVSVTAVVSKFIAEHQTPANLLQGLILFSLSDVLAQIIQSPMGVPDYTKAFSINWTRARNAGLFGMIYSGGVIATWIRWIDGKYPSERLNVNAVVKVLLDIIVFGAVGNSMNILVRGCFAGGCPAGWETVKRKAGRVFKNDLKVFPLADLMCFTVVKKEFRASFVGLVSLGWNTWISIVANGEH
ncbi:hypothetical protein TrVE_jg3658 [Triparma verrucosa]|uniref:Uncharacterized protein n=1 Tax=Triparma verrucosa TaxID=1606542 RepID=A0A9W7BS16_9STRA|nr:hypothetical protein TrVE_jg3658 [Triparma verrucosa]